MQSLSSARVAGEVSPFPVHIPTTPTDVDTSPKIRPPVYDPETIPPHLRKFVCVAETDPPVYPFIDPRGIPPHLRALVRVIEDDARDHTSGWSSNARLADRYGCTERNVVLLLNALVALGIVARVPNPKGRPCERDGIILLWRTNADRPVADAETFDQEVQKLRARRAESKRKLREERTARRGQKFLPLGQAERRETARAERVLADADFTQNGRTSGPTSPTIGDADFTHFGRNRHQPESVVLKPKLETVNVDVNGATSPPKSDPPTPPKPTNPDPTPRPAEPAPTLTAPTSTESGGATDAGAIWRANKVVSLLNQLRDDTGHVVELRAGETIGVIVPKGMPENRIDEEGMKRIVAELKPLKAEVLALLRAGQVGRRQSAAEVAEQVRTVTPATVETAARAVVALHQDPQGETTLKTWMSWLSDERLGRPVHEALADAVLDSARPGISNQKRPRYLAGAARNIVNAHKAQNYQAAPNAPSRN